VTDSGGLTHDETITVNVNDMNEAPTAIAPTSFAINENTDTTGGVSVGTLATTDPDTGDTFTYSIQGGADAANFSIGGAGDELILDDGVLNFEAKSSYTVVVRVTDSDGNTHDETITVNVNNLVEPVSPISDTDAGANTAGEDAGIGSAVGITALATDPDVGDTVTYSLDDDAGGRFSIDANTGMITVSAALDAETATSHNVTVRATSSDGSFSGRIFTISVSDVNEAPVGPISDTDASSDSVAENVGVGTAVGITALATDPDVTDTVTYSLDDDAGGRFAIDTNTGLVTVAGAIDFENASSHNVTVRATGTDGSFTTRVFTISVNDVNEAPTAITPTSFLVDENTNTTGGYSMGSLTTTDPDSPESFTYSIVGGADAANVSIGGAGSDELVLDDGTLDFEAKSTYTVVVRVTDSGGFTHDETMTVNVNNLNDAPVLDNSGTMTLTDINEDDMNPPGDTVAAIIASAGGDRITDQDSGAVEGVAVVAVDDTNGQWQYSTTGGATWLAFGAVSDTSAVLLDTGAQIRFVPNANYNGPAGNITLRAWDQTSGASGDTGVDVSTNGGSTAYSSGTETATLDVNPVNDAPLLDNTGVMTLTNVNEDATNPAGDTLAAILASAGGDRITDADAGAVEGFAVVGVDNSNGQWQYSTDGGATWLAFGATSDSSAVLLDTAARVRFVPSANYAGSAGNITFRAWDQATGANGQAGVNVSANGGTTAYSSATETATLSINPINDAPVARNDAYTVNQSQSLSVNAAGVLSNDSDVDGDPLTVMLVSGPSSGTLALNANGSFVYTLGSGFRGTDTFTYRVDDGSSLSNTATVSIVQPVAPPPPLPPPGPGPSPDGTPDEPVDSFDDRDDRDDRDDPDDRASRGRDEDDGDSTGPSRHRPNRAGKHSADELRLPAVPTAAELESWETSTDTNSWTVGFCRDPYIGTARFESSRFDVMDVAAMELDESIQLDDGVRWSQLDDLARQLARHGQLASVTHVMLAATGAAFSVGFVAWTLRASYLTATLMSSLPAWHRLDPLPVLDFAAAKSRDKRRSGETHRARGLLDLVAHEGIAQVGPDH
jgi:Tfp pilus assembly protein FimT